MRSRVVRGRRLVTLANVRTDVKLQHEKQGRKIKHTYTQTLQKKSTHRESSIQLFECTFFESKDREMCVVVAFDCDLFVQDTRLRSFPHFLFEKQVDHQNLMIGSDHNPVIYQNKRNTVECECDPCESGNFAIKKTLEKEIA